MMNLKSALLAGAIAIFLPTAAYAQPPQHHHGPAQMDDHRREAPPRYDHRHRASPPPRHMAPPPRHMAPPHHDRTEEMIIDAAVTIIDDVLRLAL